MVHQMVPFKLTLPILATLFALTTPILELTAFQPPRKDSATRNYKDQLPHIPPKSPAEALKTFKLHPGYAIELVSSEPLIRDPVAMAFDAAGRLYVCQMPEYNQYVNKSFKGVGSIKRLEDKDGDGRFETATMFLDKVPSPCAIACYKGGVFVGSVPNLLYCKDTNGDGKADVRRVVFRGFARDKAGEAMMNSIRWGLDNRFHMSTSLAGGLVGAADKKGKSRSVRGRGFRFDPRSEAFDLTSGGGQHGMSMDDWGRKFVCSNSNPAQTLVYDDRYLPRNPYLTALPAAQNITKGKYTNIYRISRVEPWRILRTRLRKKRIVRGGDEGGKPAGFFTASTGVTIFRGDGLAAVKGNLLVGEAASNMIYRAKLTPQGVSLQATRTGPPKQEFLASTDNWFRPVQLGHGPDGTLYVLDMYRELIEGAAFLPDLILKHMNVAGGINRGRIYRISRQGVPYKKRRDLTKISTLQLVKLLQHPNGWLRDTASRLIYERQDVAAAPALRRLLQQSHSTIGRAHALGTLVGLQQATASDLVRALQDPNPRLRELAIKFCEPHMNRADVRNAVLRLRADGDPRVRFQLAFSLGFVPASQRLPVLESMLPREGADRWFRLALLSSAHGLQGQLVERLSSIEKRPSHVNALLGELVSQAARSGRDDLIVPTVKTLVRLNQSDKALAATLLETFVLRLPSAARQKHVGPKSPARSLIDAIVRRAQAIALDRKRLNAQRVVAVSSLRLANWQQVRESLQTCLTPTQPLDVQHAAIQVMGRFTDQQVAETLLARWSGFGPKTKNRCLEVLLSRPAWVPLFLNAYQAGKIGSSEVDLARVRLLQQSRDKKIAAVAKRLFGRTLSKRADVVKRYQPALKLKGQRLRGKAVFKANCSVCHKLEGVGNAIGADLKAIKDRGNLSILLNILDPNREVKPQFVNYIVTTDEGVVVTGMIIQESANNITIRKADGTNVSILRVEIETMRSTGISFMPVGLEKKLKMQDMADLLEYLNSIEK